MNTINKRKYIKPHFKVIKIDKGVTLQLESEPPIGPNEFSSQISNININNDHFKSNIM